MGWLNTNSDRVLLFIVALVLIAASLFTIREGLNFHLVKTPPTNKHLESTFQPLSAVPVTEARFSFKAPLLWEHKSNPLFVSRMYVLKEGQLIDPIENQEPLFPPIPNAWIFQYGLDIELPDLLNADSDGDGFSNLEEWRGKTDPTDKYSHPPYWTKLRYDNYKLPPFQVKFSGSPDGGKVFTINPVNNPDAHTQFLKLGETLNVNGTLYTLINYKEEYVSDKGVSKNASELILQNQKTGGTVTLVYDQVVNSPVPIATFKNLIDGSVFAVKEGDTFTIPQEANITYKLINLSPTLAQIQSAANAETHDIEIHQPTQ